MVIQVVPYEDRWRSDFDAEAHRIATALGDGVVRLHHIGSTAIPGIGAKPVIDMLLEVADLSELDRRAARLAPLGYEAKGEYGIPGRRYFRRDDAAGTRTHHLHAFVAGSAAVDRHLAFRDYLIAHPLIARAYGELKQRLAQQFPDDMNAYMDGKDAFIKHHEAEALRWRATIPRAIAPPQ
jgi:GrpB-like predicted nucleotidyltransferase (UPF0157 family)